MHHFQIKIKIYFISFKPIFNGNGGKYFATSGSGFLGIFRPASEKCNFKNIYTKEARKNVSLTQNLKKYETKIYLPKLHKIK